MGQYEGSRAWYDCLRTVIGTVLAVLAVFTFVARLIPVDGESMRETLQDRDWMVVVNPTLAGAPEAGDIVVVGRLDFRDGQPIVKRVIATAGQTVDIDFAAGTVCVDGRVLEEPYIREATHVDEGTAFPLTVPEGAVFVLGDNRGDSEDSRSPALGTVDVRCIIGKTVFLALPGKSADTDRRDWSRIGMI